MFKLGLTGGIASGKSAVAAEFAKLGAYIVDADDIARQVVAPGSAALTQIVAHFGAEILTGDAQLNRALLRQIIFRQADEKAWLENLLHPLIRNIIIQQLNAPQENYTILVSPLLFESHQHTLVDRVLVVDAPVTTQLERAQNRDGNTPELITAIINSQLSREERCKRADDILDNAGEFTQTITQIHALHNTYLKLAHDR